MIYNPSNYRVDGTTMKLIEIYPTAEDFITDYQTIGLTNIPFQDQNFLKTIYYLLMGEYADSATTNSSLDMFRYRFMTRIMSYGPQFERELAIQAELLGMDDESLQMSSETIYNQATNPSKKPPVDSRKALDYIDSQSATLHKRSKLDAWSYLFSMLDGDITAKFIARFDDLFRPVLWGNEAVGYAPLNLEGGYTI